MLFAKYLRDLFPSLADKYKFYSHEFENGIEVDARQYPNELLPTFIKFIDDIWIPEYAESYFRDRDPKALGYLPKLLKAS